MARLREKVKTYERIDSRSGKVVRVGSFSRRAKTKRKGKIRKLPPVKVAFGKKRYEVAYYQDEQGRLVGRRRWTTL